MPGIPSPKQSFPGIDKLPPIVQALIERIFPPDSLPMPAAGGAVLGPRNIPAQPAAKSLEQAFKPWGKHLEKAYPQMYGPSEVPPPPSSVGLMHQSLENLLSQMKKPF